MKIGSKCLHAGYEPKNGESRVLPIYQGTTYKHDSTDFVEQLLNPAAEGHMYSRISNPMVDVVGEKIATLEDGVGALCTTSGQSATFLTLTNVLESGDHLVASSTIYGSSVNLLSITFREFGIEMSYVDPDAVAEGTEKLVRPNTEVVFGKIMTSPVMNILGIEKFASVAYVHDIPLPVDNTFTTPVLCRSLRFGVGIVIHSTAKYMDGYVLQIGGVAVDGGIFNWANSKFPGLSTPDTFYHGIVYADTFKEAAYIIKARVQLMRDLGCYPTVCSASLLNPELEALAVRTGRHCANARRTAEFLESQDAAEFVSHPGLKQNRYHALTQEYLPKGRCGVISFLIKGGKERAAVFIGHLKIVSLEVRVTDICIRILRPVSSTYQQPTDEQLVDCGITPGLIRLSCRIEHVDDILEDLTQAFAQIWKIKQHADQYTEWSASQADSGK